jgi:hypothetical protein
LVDASRSIESRGPKVKRICALLLVALGAGGVAPAALAVDAPPAPSPPPASARGTTVASVPPAPATTPATVPPALQALEQKMAQIRLRSVSFSARLDLGTGKSSGSLNVTAASAKSSEDLIVTTRGVIGLSPPLQSSTSTVAGIPNAALGGEPLRELRIGATTYSYEPSIARRDGRRPWIRSTRTRQEEKLAARLAPLTDLYHPLLAGLQRPAAASTGPFAPLLEELRQAQGVQETGPATVDGQQTVGFTVAVSPAKLLAKLVSSKQGHGLFKKGPPPGLRYTMELWIAPSGLPVRVEALGAPGEGFASQEDILATEVPVLVNAPPASKTIGQARLAKIERRLEQAVSRCIRRHPRRVQACVKRYGGQI